MGTEEDIAALRRDVLAAQQRHARAADAARQADARAASVREDLQAEFGVSTAAEAAAGIADLERELEAAAAEVRRQLDLAGGS